MGFFNPYCKIFAIFFLDVVFLLRGAVWAGDSYGYLTQEPLRISRRPFHSLYYGSNKEILPAISLMHPFHPHKLSFLVRAKGNQSKPSESSPYHLNRP